MIQDEEDNRKPSWLDKHPSARFAIFSSFSSLLIAAGIAAIVKGRFQLGRWNPEEITRAANPFSFWFWIILLVAGGTALLVASIREFIRGD